MAQPARVLEDADVRRVLKHVTQSDSRYMLRNTAIFMLSIKAGLRACEVAGLRWDRMVLKPNGRVDDFLTIANDIAKYGSGRVIPMPPDLKAALLALHKHEGRPTHGPVIKSHRGTHMRSQSIVNWFQVLYQELSLTGCSSHSGRRGYATRAARILPRTGGSIRDLAELLGHKSIATTEKYLVGSRPAQLAIARLI
jgi:integrase/recombinase XerD